MPNTPKSTIKIVEAMTWGRETARSATLLVVRPGTYAEASDPSSPRYLKHLSREEVASMLAPAPESVDAVRRWLAGHGVEEDISKRSFSGDWVRATVSVAKARSMLGDADFAEWHNERSGETLVRAIEYSLPREIFE